MTTQAVLLVSSARWPLDEGALLQAIELATQSSGKLHCLCVYDELRWSSRFASLLPDQASVKQSLTQRAKEWVNKQLAEAAHSYPCEIHVVFGHLSLETIRHCLAHPVSLIIKAAEKPEWADSLFDSEDLQLLRKSPVPVWITVPAQSSAFRNVVVSLDFDHEDNPESRELNQRLLLTAATIARRQRAPLRLINVYNTDELSFAKLWAEDPERLEQDLLADEKITRQAAMQQLLEDVQTSKDATLNDLTYTTHLVPGNPKQAIAATVSKFPSPLLVMGSVARSGIAGLLIGNTAESTLTQVTCPVLVIKPDKFVTPVTL